MAPKVLDAMGPRHGYGIARRIEQVSEQVLQLNEGTVYTSLLRLQQQGWIASDWGRRKTTARRNTIRSPRAVGNSSRERPQNWERIAGVIGRQLRLEGR